MHDMGNSNKYTSKLQKLDLMVLEEFECYTYDDALLQRRERRERLGRRMTEMMRPCNDWGAARRIPYLVQYQHCTAKNGNVSLEDAEARLLALPNAVDALTTAIDELKLCGSDFVEQFKYVNSLLARIPKD